MLAIIKERPQPGVAVMDRPEPVPAPGEVLVVVDGTGICGSDLHAYEWVPEYAWLGPHLPTILGHEIGGRVVDANGAGVPTGVPVAVRPAVTCGRCAACQRGVSQRCPNRVRIGLERDGGLARYVVAPAENVYAIPERGAAMAPIVEPLTVAVHAAKRMTLRPGAPAAVVGVGAIGLLLVEVLLAHGAGSVLLVGTEADEAGGGLAVGQALGATSVVAGSAEWGAHAGTCEGVIVAAGAPAAVLGGLQLADRGADVVVLGLGIGTAAVDVDTAVRRELSLVGAFGSVPADWLDAVDLVAAGRVTGEDIVSHELPVKDGAEAFALLADRKARKIVIRPQED
jgi:threonine 3-dehydrogenase